MINVLMCVHKSGDVLPLSLVQLIEVPEVTRILVADGPHLGPNKPGILVDEPSVKNVVQSFKSRKLYYEYTDHCFSREQKNNRILAKTTSDCEWILCVDSDEVYHEDHLKNLVRFLRSSPPYDRYKIITINPFPDLLHEIRFPDAKPRLYRYRKGYRCPKGDRNHQYVHGPGQKTCPTDASRGLALLPPEICKIYHLNALRSGQKRVKWQENGDVIWSGDRRTARSKIYPLSLSDAPRCIRELNRTTL